MNLEFLLQAEVWAILKELSWGDRFDRDLQAKVTEVKGSLDRFKEIKKRLTDMGLVYQLKGGKGSPYLALTYKGQEVVSRLIEAQEILESEYRE